MEVCSVLQIQPYRNVGEEEPFSAFLPANIHFLIERPTLKEKYELLDHFNGAGEIGPDNSP